LLIISILIGLLIAETLLYLFWPRESLYPIFNFSPDYGWVLPKSTRMTHKKGKEWRFDYEINEKGYRGSIIEQKRSIKTIIALGDSYLFGQCIEEEKTFTNILNRELVSSPIRIVNMAVPGWSLGQEMKRFYNEGLQYFPDAVLLQFCSNDPMELLTNPVCSLTSDTIKFIPTTIKQPGYLLKGNRKFKKTQLYRLVRGTILNIKYTATTPNTPNYQSYYQAQLSYLKLFNNFTSDLKKRNIRLYIMDVNGQLSMYPLIYQTVLRLKEQGFLVYINPNQWFTLNDSYLSPDGHLWNEKAHRIIANNLKEILISN
jgi:hypothetical protein